MSKSTEPEWVIDEHWGVSTDPYNWTLMKRTTGRKTGELAGWKAVAYYNTPAALFRGLAERSMREPSDKSIADHAIAAYKRVEQQAARFSAALVLMPEFGRKPPRIGQNTETEKAA